MGSLTVAKPPSDLGGAHSTGRPHDFFLFPPTTLEMVPRGTTTAYYVRPHATAGNAYVTRSVPESTSRADHVPSLMLTIREHVTRFRTEAARARSRLHSLSISWVRVTCRIILFYATCCHQTILVYCMSSVPELFCSIIVSFSPKLYSHPGQQIY